MMKIQMGQRVDYFDFLRGVAIIMVIAIHTFAATYAASEPGAIAIIIRQVLNCSVPLFLAISGFFLATKTKCNSTPYDTLLKRQIPKVYIPTLIWSLPYLAVSLINGGDIVKSFLLFFMCGFSIYYFIALIIQYYILFPVINRLKTQGVIGACIITLTAIGFLTYLTGIKGLAIPMLLSGGPFPVWLAFFTIGVYLGKRETRQYHLWPWVIVAVVFLVLAYFGATYIHSIRLSGGFGIKPSTHVFSFALIMLLFSGRVQALFHNDNILSKAVVYIGRISFGLYLIHCFFIQAIGLFPFQFGWGALTLIVLAVSVLFVHMVKMILPYSVYKYLGFA